MYKANNPIPTTGAVKMYTQKRYIQTILWARKYLPADTNKVFVIGISAGGFGAYLTANLVPDIITYAYCIVGDFKVIAIDNNDTPCQMWGDTLKNLASDVNPKHRIPFMSIIFSIPADAAHQPESKHAASMCLRENDMTIRGLHLPLN
jgi:hypothetical protein